MTTRLAIKNWRFFCVVVVALIGIPQPIAGQEVVTPGTVYAIARKQTLQTGYGEAGISKSVCLDQIAGRNVLCEYYPEMYYCSGGGQGQCEALFRSGDRLLIVRIEGEEEENSKREPGLDLKVAWSRFATPQEKIDISERLHNLHNEVSRRPPPAPSHYDANRIAFFGSTEWVLIKKMATWKGDLLFRRYAVKVANPDGDTEFNPATFKLDIVDATSLTNHQIYLCRRNGQNPDHLTLHLPENIELRSFKLNSWKNDLELRTLADGQSRRWKSEFIRGDFFVDLRPATRDDFGALITATRVTYEFGEQNDRVHHVTTDQFASFNIRYFMRQAIPSLFKLEFHTYRYFDTTEMIAACNQYRRTGKLPNFY